jgi:hypothetical protein
MTFAEWDESHASRAEARAQQADGLIRWLDQTDDLIKTRLMPMITPTSKKVQTQHTAAAQGDAEPRIANVTDVGGEVESDSHLDPWEAAWVEEALSEVRENVEVAPTAAPEEEEDEDEEEGEEEEGEEVEGEHEGEESSEQDGDEQKGGHRGPDEPPPVGMPE